MDYVIYNTLCGTDLYRVFTYESQDIFSAVGHEGVCLGDLLVVSKTDEE